IDQPDSGERRDDAADAIDQQIAAQQGGRAHGPVLDAAQGQRNERDDNQRIEDDAGEHGAVRVVQAHDVEPGERRIDAHEHGRQDREEFGDIVGDGKRGERAARHEELFADGDDLDELGGIAVEVHHIAGFLGGHGAGVHRQADIGLGEGGGVVGAVTGHGDEASSGLLLLDQVHLVLGGGLGEEIVHSRFGRDGGGGQRVIAGDHDGADSHVAQLLEALAHAALDDIFQVHHAEDAIAIGHRQRGAAKARDAVGDFDQLRRDLATLLADELGDAIGGALANAASVQIHAAHAGLRGERDEMRLVFGHLAAANVVLLFGEDHDGAALRRLVGQAGKLRRVGQLLLAHAFQRQELDGLAVAQRDGAGFVQQQRVDVAGGLYRLAAHGEHVVLHDAVHAGDADGGKQAADGGGDEADEQRDQNRHGGRRAFDARGHAGI